MVVDRRWVDFRWELETDLVKHGRDGEVCAGTLAKLGTGGSGAAPGGMESVTSASD